MRAVFAIPGAIETPTGGYKYDREVLARLGDHDVDCRHLELPGGFPFPDPTAVDTALARIGTFERDAVLLIDGLAFGALPTERLLDALPARTVALVHHPLGYETGLAPDVARSLVERERSNLALCDAVIVTSFATSRSLQGPDFQVPIERITVAEPGTDLAEAATGSTDGRVHLLAVGAISRRKGYDVLVNALSSLRDLPWHATIAGADDRAPDVAAEVKAQIAQAGLGDRIRLLGNVETRALDRLYAAADVFVMPSRYEGYGMVLAEAMARGLPIVCTTGGAAADTAPKDAAIKVPPGDATAFAEAVRRLVEQPALRQRMARASRQAGIKLPDWDSTAAIIAWVLRGTKVQGAQP